MDFLEGRILSVGKKLKRIRKYLGANQDDITGQKITRSLVSYIENGKTKLTYDTASILAEELNKFAKQRKINFSIDAEYLLQNELEQLNQYLDKVIINLKDIIYVKNYEEFEKELKKIETLLTPKDVPEKELVIYTLAADFYYSKKDYVKSYFYCVKALENAIKCEDTIKMVEIVLKLGYCEMKLENYAQAINFNNYAIIILKNNKIEQKNLMNRASFNNALSYKKLEEYDKCLAILDNLEAQKSNFSINQEIDILTLRGNCYSNKGQTHTARKTYQKIIFIAEQFNNLEALAKAYINISDSYYKDDNIYESIDYDIKCLEIREKINSNLVFRSYFSLGKKYLEINELELSRKHLAKAVKEAKKYSSMNVLFESLNLLLSIYIRNYDDSSIDLLIDEVDQIRKEFSKAAAGDFDVIYFKASYYYISKNVEKSKKLLKVGLDIKTQGNYLI